MFLVGILSWWYGEGWMMQARKVGDRIRSLLDYFSIDELLRTFFSPYRQISAGGVRGPIAVQLRAFFDRTFSRVIGAIVRFFVIIIGIVAIFIAALIGLITLVLWALLPLSPIFGTVAMFSGWTPAWIL